jgi:hypothetical protein
MGAFLSKGPSAAGTSEIRRLLIGREIFEKTPRVPRAVVKKIQAIYRARWAPITMQGIERTGKTGRRKNNGKQAQEQGEKQWKHHGNNEERGRDATLSEATEPGGTRFLAPNKKPADKQRRGTTRTKPRLELMPSPIWRGNASKLPVIPEIRTAMLPAHEGGSLLRRPGYIG